MTASPARMTVFSIAQALPMLLSLKLLLSPQEGRVNPGARLAGLVAMLDRRHLCRPAVRRADQLGGGFSYMHFSPAQSVVMLVLMFLSMSLNFGFLLMAIDRLRNEVADLALLDDLTGVGNRRHLVQRLTEECARSERSGEPFALLVIDLDGFKAINDTHGHAAGDACLQHFTLMAQTRLRPGDMLARTGGDEFCIVLPSSTLREGAMIARRVLDVCRADAEACVGNDIPIAVSIGVAQWTREMGAFPDRLIAAADHALYDAKKDGKNRYAAYAPAPPLAPGTEAQRGYGRAPVGPIASKRRVSVLKRSGSESPGPGLSDHEPSFACDGALRHRIFLSGLCPDARSRRDRRASGTPDIPGLKMVWLAPWGDVAKAHPWRNIIVHQTEGPAGSARGGAQAQRRTRPGAASWSGSKPTARSTGRSQNIWFRPIPTAPTATTTNTSTTARPITRSTGTIRSASSSPAIIPM